MLGYLSNNEALVLVWLILLADHTSGSGTTNAPAIRTYLPELSIDAAKRTLRSLEDKRYIYRHITPFSKRVYQYWVDGYVISQGSNDALQISLEQVFDSRDAKDIRYINPAPEGALQGALQPAPRTALQGAHNNNTITRRSNDKDTKKTTSVIKEMIDSQIHSENDSLCAAACSAIATTSGERSAHGDSHKGDRLNAHTDAHTNGVGLRWDSGQGVYLDTQTGRAIPFDVVDRRIIRLGLKRIGSEFFDEQHIPVAWKIAQARITGSTLVREAA
jgi:hypothetical protein